MKEFEKYVDYKPPLRKSVSVDKITIEKNIKMPKKNGRLYSVLSEDVRNALSSMEVGDSFEVDQLRTVQIVQNYGRTIGKKFASRKYFVGARQSTKNQRWRIWYERDFFDHEINKWKTDTSVTGLKDKDFKEAFLKAEKRDVLSAAAVNNRSTATTSDIADSEYIILQGKVIFLENCIAGICEEMTEIAQLMKEESVFAKSEVGKQWKKTHSKFEKMRKGFKDGKS